MLRRRVLVTRPQPGADRTAARLGKIGYEPLVLPLSRTIAMPQSMPPVLPELILATSAKALLHLDPALAARLSACRLLAVGESTANAARDCGFSSVQLAGGDVTSLLRGLGGQGQNLSEALYLAGKVRRPELELALSTRAARLTVLEVYDTIPVSHTTDILSELACVRPVDAILVTSVMGAVEIAQLAGTPICRELFEKTMIIAISHRVAAALGGCFSGRVHVADTPDENGLATCLAAHCPPR